MIGVADNCGILSVGTSLPAAGLLSEFVDETCNRCHALCISGVTHVNAAYVYPDRKHALVGSWIDGKMARALPTARFNEDAFYLHCQSYFATENNRLWFEHLRKSRYG